MAPAQGPPLPAAILGYIHHNAYRLTSAIRAIGPQLDVEDLIQVGIAECWRAQARYDPERGPLGTFLYRRLRGAMIDYLRDHGWGGRLHHREMRPISSLDQLFSAPGHEDQDHVSLDLRDRTADAAFHRFEDQEALRDAIAELEERERYVLAQSFFGERRLVDIGADLGVTESRASQIRTQALRHLRLSLTA